MLLVVSAAGNTFVFKDVVQMQNFLVGYCPWLSVETLV
jgi:hypothetical protein